MFVRANWCDQIDRTTFTIRRIDAGLRRDDWPDILPTNLGNADALVRQKPVRAGSTTIGVAYRQLSGPVELIITHD